MEETTSAQKSSTVGGGVVLKTNIQSVTGELVGTGRGQDTVTIDERVSNLANDLTVGETDDETVFGRLVLVLGLAAETLTLTVVGTSLAATTELNLEALVVRLGLDLYEYLYFGVDRVVVK